LSVFGCPPNCQHYLTYTISSSCHSFVHPWRAMKGGCMTHGSFLNAQLCWKKLSFWVQFSCCFCWVYLLNYSYLRSQFFTMFDQNLWAFIMFFQDWASRMLAIAKHHFVFSLAPPWLSRFVIVEELQRWHFSLYGW